MRRRLALAWLFGMTSAVLHAGENSVTVVPSLKLPRIFRQSRQTLYLPDDNSDQPTFDLKTTIPSDGDVVQIDASIVNDSVDDEVTDAGPTNNLRTGFARMDSSESPPEPQRESTFPSPRPPSKSSGLDAIPLDGALRGELGPNDEEEDEPDSLESGYSSLGWIAGANNRLGMVELDFKPSPRVWYDPLQPAQGYLGMEFGARWLNGPNTPDLPPQLFSLLINVGQRFELNDRQKLEVMLSPGWFTDFSNKGIQAFRLPWQAVLYHQLDDDWHAVMGVTDLARDDISYLPVLGMVYAPWDGDFRLDMVFPKPKIAWRWATTESSSQWLTLGGELGGASYAISRANRDYDVATYRDYRLVAGIEGKQNSGQASRLEFAWIFGRAVEYRSGDGNYSPGDTFMIRMSSDY